ncbi:zinc ribbon domain-containing protein, partial [Rubellimicrobium aerolatum]
VALTSPRSSRYKRLRSFRRPFLSTRRDEPSGLSASQALRRPKYLLSGILVCGRCGGKLTIAGSGDKRYYCANARQKGPAICEGMPGVRQEEEEDQALSSLQRT